MSVVQPLRRRRLALPERPALAPSPLPLDDLFQRGLREHLALFDTLDGLREDVEHAARALTDCLRRGGKLLFCGNGGSAADSQHLAAEFTGRFQADRRPLAAMALTTDSSVLTCIGNDYDFTEVFARQVAGLGRARDGLIGISTSGMSANVVRAMETARGLGLTTVGLLGRDGGRLAPLCDVPIVVPSQATARIQEAHIFIGHALCALIEQRLRAAGALG
jgi:D-sedoheptulose 7-phosphate isomerase